MISSIGAPASSPAWNWGLVSPFEASVPRFNRFRDSLNSQLSTLNFSSILLILSISGTKTAPVPGGVRFPGPKNAVFACIGGLGTRFPGAVPNGSRGSQPVSMVQFFPPWPGQLPTPNHPATCIICVSAPVPVHSTFVSLTHSPTHPLTLA